ncbi:MAG: PrgI family protein [Candidatus Nanosynbacter sp.]|nr:PrgI family protein [Candidatus Nanosynbacter sp.]
MSVYKVPQDVEAEDKLLGPFSFRQFVFLIIAVIGIAIAYGLSTILLPLAIIPVPIILFFGALALPLKKDQPMEVYLAAVISFMLKPKKRLWQPDGIERLVEVIAPKVEEKTYGNNYDQAEVQRRLSYLANLVDSQGWSIRGVNNPNSSMRADLFNEGQAANDILDENSATAQNINHLINQSDVRRRQEVIQKMQTGQSTTPPPAQTPQPNNPTPAASLQMNPYPTMRQSVLNPVSEQPAASAPAQTQPTTTPQASVNEVPPAIIELANNRDLSIETIAREANRIQQENKLSDEEVVISLR